MKLIAAHAHGKELIPSGSFVSHWHRVVCYFITYMICSLIRRLNVIFVEIIIYLLLKVDGGWGEWYAWSECSVACEKGEIRRLRICDNPAPQQGGKCRGTNSETETCNGPSCPGTLIRLQTV